MHLLEIATAILLLTTLFSYLNERFLKKSPTIGVVIISLFFSLSILMTHMIIPTFGSSFTVFMKEIKFDDLLLKAMLGILLFAGSFNLDIKLLGSVKKEVASSAIIGTVLSTLLFALLFHSMSTILKLQMPFVYSLLFGSLISPTDPIATLAVLKEKNLDKTVEYKIAGESLFNDAVGVVLFTAILDIISKGGEALSAPHIAGIFFREALAGSLVGLLFGIIASFFFKAISSRIILMLFSLSLVLGLTLLAERAGFSLPLAVIFCGLFLSWKKDKLPEGNCAVLRDFWDDLDGMLNLILFILIGLESVLIFEHFNPLFLLAGTFGILAILASRLLSVAVLLLPEKRNGKSLKGLLIVLTWGALRGGLAFALALSIPESPQRHIIVLITYIIVLFSIIIQGLSIGKVAEKNLK